MPKNWDDVKSEIRSYYIDEGRSLEEVRQLMKENYQFEASSVLDPLQLIELTQHDSQC